MGLLANQTQEPQYISKRELPKTDPAVRAANGGEQQAKGAGCGVAADLGDRQENEEVRPDNRPPLAD